MEAPTPLRPFPHELPDLAGLECDEDFLRAAERISPAIRERVASAEAAQAWRARLRAVLGDGGRPGRPEAERRASIDRAVARAVADAAARERLLAEIAERLRDLKRGGSAAGGG